jgi:hypothetical protein
MVKLHYTILANPESGLQPSGGLDAWQRLRMSADGSDPGAGEGR